VFQKDLSGRLNVGTAFINYHTGATKHATSEMESCSKLLE